MEVGKLPVAHAEFHENLTVENHVEAEKRSLAIGLVGNVITQPFAALGKGLGDACSPVLHHLPFGQVHQVLAESRPLDVLILHLDHRWFFPIAPGPEAMSRMDDLIPLLEAYLEKSAASVILNTIPFAPTSPIASDLHTQIEILAALNRKLFDFARSHGRVSVIDVAGLVAEVGYANAIRERNRYVMQHPYSAAATELLVSAYASAIRVMLRARRKVIVVDADDTLWKGILGEDGVAGIAVDEQYPGVIHYLFQQQLVRMHDLGFLICVVTKNNPEDFLEVFATRQMPLRLDHVILYKSNWQPKSDNIRDVARELNVGLDSIVFIDDNPFEVDEVRSALPAVECHVFPKDSIENVLALLPAMRSLGARGLTQEDQVKTSQYRAEFQRRSGAAVARSLDEYLRTLEIRAVISRNEVASLGRIVQLINKTNQFNLTTRRYTEADVHGFMRGGDVYSMRVMDKFGDLGIVAVLIVLDGAIDTFVMSCRALGRGAEVALLRHVFLSHEGQLRAEYIESSKNELVREFYDNNGFSPVSETASGKIYAANGGPNAAKFIDVVTNQ